MRQITIQKSAGGRRVIYMPSKSEKARLSALAEKFASAERKLAALRGTADVAHGFIAGRSPVTMALPHRGMAVTVSCDLKSWFDSVRPDQIESALVAVGYSERNARSTADRACYLGAPRQGLPSSPAACNLAAVALDRIVLDTLPRGVVYTRYADDMVVSLPTDEQLFVTMTLRALESAAVAMGWTIATQKTRVQRVSGGRRVICGVSVADDIAAPRSMRRRLRSAQHNTRRHNLDARVVDGLSQWCAMRLPKAARSVRIISGIGARAMAHDDAPARIENNAQVIVGSSGRRIIMGGDTP